MRILTRCLDRGNALAQTIEDDASVLIVYGRGGECALDIAGRVSGVWIPLHGVVRVRTTNQIHSIHAKELLITEYDERVKTVARSNNRWLAMLAGQRAWGRLLIGASESGRKLLPDQCNADPKLRRLAIALVRSASEFERESILRDTTDAIVALQTPLREMVARCPGRTLQEKRRVFLRLQRVRHFIRASCDAELDNAALAGMANYSPSHFLRIFNAVFQETPHAYLVGQRLHRAARLLHSGKLAVTEVALASGFENRSAFSRLFRRHFGITASEARSTRPTMRAEDA